MKDDGAGEGSEYTAHRIFLIQSAMIGKVTSI